MHRAAAQVSSRIPGLVLIMSLLCLVVAAEAQRGGGGRGGGGRRSGGRGGQSVQQKPGTPAEARFIRVCRALSLSKDQLKKTKARFDSMEVKRQLVIEKQQIGAVSSLAARQELSRLGSEFEEQFIALLDEDQRKKLEKLKDEGTLSDEWW